MIAALTTGGLTGDWAERGAGHRNLAEAFCHGFKPGPDEHLARWVMENKVPGHCVSGNATVLLLRRGVDFQIIIIIYVSIGNPGALRRTCPPLLRDSPPSPAPPCTTAVPQWAKEGSRSVLGQSFFFFSFCDTPDRPQVRPSSCRVGSRPRTPSRRRLRADGRAAASFRAPEAPI